MVPLSLGKPPNMGFGFIEVGVRVSGSLWFVFRHILGLYRDNGKEHGGYFIIIGCMHVYM